MPNTTTYLDLYYAYKFLKILITPWENLTAYKFGVIDKNGNKIRDIKDRESSDVYNSYSTFNRLVFNIKRLIEKVPGGKSKIGSLSAALLLLRENNKEKVSDKYLFEKILYNFWEEGESVVNTNSIGDMTIEEPLAKMVKRMKRDKNKNGVSDEGKYQKNNNG